MDEYTPHIRGHLAWHFTADRLRDGRPIPPVGETLRHEGSLAMCESGLHASVRALDALQYAPGFRVHRVRCGGQMLHGNDKLVCSERTILWSADASEVLPAFARWCALQVVDLWDAPEIVKTYLHSGDESLQAAAAAAAARAAEAAAWAAARAAEAAEAAAWAAEAAEAAARAAAAAAARAAEAAEAAAWAAVMNCEDRKAAFNAELEARLNSLGKTGV